MNETSSSIVERIRALEGAGITDVFVKKRVPSYAAQAAAIGDSIHNNYSENLLATKPKTTKIYQNPANYVPTHSVSSLNSSLSSPPNRQSEPENDDHEPINQFTNIIPEIYHQSPTIEQRTSSRNELNDSLNRAPSIESIENDANKSQEVDYRVTNLVSNLTDAKKNLRRVSVNRDEFDYNLHNNNNNSRPPSSINPEEVSLQVPIANDSRHRSASGSSNNSVFKYAKSDSIRVEPRLPTGSTENISNLNMFNPLGSKRSSVSSIVKNQIDELNSNSSMIKHEPNALSNHSIHDESRQNSTNTFKHELNQSNDASSRKSSASTIRHESNNANLFMHESRKNSVASSSSRPGAVDLNETNNESRKSSASMFRHESRNNSSSHNSTISVHKYEVNPASDANVSLTINNNESRKSSTSISNKYKPDAWLSKESRKSSTSTLKNDELSPSNSFSGGLNNSNKEESTNFNNNSYSQSNKRLLIYNDQVTKAMSQTIHPEHFACWNCDTSLTGSRYILRDDHPYCISCYEDLFANECEECRKKIGTDSKDLSYKDKHWHEKCFFCHVCKLPLVDKPFGNKNDSLYCSECYNQAFASRCDKCAQIFKPGMKKMEYKGQQFHETCFLCYSCNTAIGTKSFIPKENRIYCVPCYENNFATKCTECMKVISQGGVSYKNQPYHKECFVCTHCQQSLAGQRFTSREDHPYCSDCFGKLFAKKCFACHNPITGIGGTKYISFEDRHWHNDCFMCNRCNSSLVGRGFLTDAMDILCPDCGKNEP